MKSILKILYCSSLFFYVSFLPASQTTPSPFPPQNVEHWILIHGTFARILPWYQKGGTGYEALHAALTKEKRKFVLHSFCWSSENNHPARTKAAHELIQLLAGIGKNSYATIHIVAHSHGATVALLAAQVLYDAKHPLVIDELFGLGMPVHTNWYLQAAEKIKTVYHFFSYGDIVQPVITMFERTLPKRKNVHNIQVKKNSECPSHEGLRSAAVLEQLPFLDTLLKDKNKYDADYCLHINTKNPHLAPASLFLDKTRAKDLEIDHAFAQQLITLYGETRKKVDASLA